MPAAAKVKGKLQNGGDGAAVFVSKTKTNSSKSKPVAPTKGKRPENRKKVPDRFEESSLPASPAKVNDKSPKNKRKREVNGFIETNLGDEEQTKAVKEKLSKKKAKISRALGVDPTLPVETIVIRSDNEEEATTNGTPVPVHKVPLETLSSSNSDDDSYIGKFFDSDGDAEFDENRVLSTEEIERKKGGDFLFAGSETGESESVSEDRCESDESDADERESVAKQVAKFRKQSSDESDDGSSDEGDDTESDFSNDSSDYGSNDCYVESFGSDDSDSSEMSGSSYDFSGEDEFSPDGYNSSSCSESAFHEFMNGHADDDSNDTDFSGE